MPTPLRVAQIDTPPGLIDLGRGDPQLALLPLEMLHRAAQNRLTQKDNAFLQYGAEQGDGYFRLALADFLSDGYGFDVDPETLFITAGISSALDLLCTLFTKWGDAVLVEEPSYFLALRIFADHGLQVVSVPTDESGLVMDRLDQALWQHRPKFLYLIPAFQNPSGHTLTEERRQRLLALAHEHSLLVIADEVYQFLSYTLQPPRCFGAYTEHPNVISLGSFSKILAPGLRLGWIQANANIIKQLAGCGLLDSGGGMNPFTSAIVRGVIESGDLKKNIARLVQVYAARLKAMDESLRRHLPPKVLPPKVLKGKALKGKGQAEFVTPHGGYFFWVRLPGIDTLELRARAAAHQVDFRPGSLFSSQAGLRDYLRLGVSFYDSDEIEEGVVRLSKCIGAS
jgi:2-aminoadipate transaminase